MSSQVTVVAVEKEVTNLLVLKWLLWVVLQWIMVVMNLVKSVKVQSNRCLKTTKLPLLSLLVLVVKKN